MSNPCEKLLLNPAWVAIYSAAMSRSSAGVSDQTVSDAEKAVLTRIRELSRRAGGEVEVERDDLEDALYTLQALKNSRAYTTAA